MTNPISQTLTEYGINLMLTPEDAVVRATRTGILVEQFHPLSDLMGDILMHEGPDGQPIEAVRVVRFYPHPERPTISGPSEAVRGNCA